MTTNPTRRICTVCIRSGSERLPNKNVTSVLGVPLFAYSLNLALDSGLFDAVVVSSDSEEYLDLARQFGADLVVRRPPELASSKVSKVHSIAHAVDAIETEAGRHFSTIVDLDASAPVRTIGDVSAMVDALESSSWNSVISAVRSKSTPFSNLFFRGDDGKLESIVDSASIEQHTGSTRECFALNGSVYVWNRSVFMGDPDTFVAPVFLYPMAQSSRYDVDTAEDFAYLEYLFSDPEFRFYRPSLPEFRGNTS